MTDNLDIWRKLEKTDPAHTKGFKRAGGFSGTAVKPIYSVQKMTEVFGPAGHGWGTSEPDFQVVNGVNNEVMVYCTVGLWWGNPGESDRRIVYGVGGDKIVSHIKENKQYNRPERWENDDEAFKKAYTDALTNAMKHLGMSADVHMGMFDDSKYVSERRREEAAGSAPANETDTNTPDALDEALAAASGDPKRLSRNASRPIYGDFKEHLESLPSIEAIESFWSDPKFRQEFDLFPVSHQQFLESYKDALIKDFNDSVEWSGEIEGKLRACITMEELKAVWSTNQERINKLLAADFQRVEEAKDQMKAALSKGPMPKFEDGK